MRPRWRTLWGWHKGLQCLTRTDQTWGSMFDTTDDPWGHVLPCFTSHQSSDMGHGKVTAPSLTSTRLQHRSETCKQVHSAQLSEWLGMRRAVWKRGLQALKSNDKNYLPMPISHISHPLSTFTTFTMLSISRLHGAGATSSWPVPVPALLGLKRVL